MSARSGRGQKVAAPVTENVRSRQEGARTEGTAQVFSDIDRTRIARRFQQSLDKGAA